MPRIQPENKSSKLLSSQENQLIFDLLGPKCITIATAVVQLFCTKVPHHSYWIKQDTGVYCFVKDNYRKSYYFRLYCLRRSGKIWEHEVYNNMEYKCSAPFLHSFEGDKCIFAFNFACLDEADHVKQIVTDKLRSRRLSAAQKETSERVENKKAPEYVNVNKKVQSTTQGKKKKHKRRLTKAEIGNPTEFRHITKVKFDFDKGLDVNSTDKKYLEIFKQAGYDEKMLENRKTREFVFDFIDNHQNMSKVTQNMQSENKPIPTRMAPRPPQNRLPPPPPPRDQQPHIKPNKNNGPSNAPPNFAPPPPPPPPRPPSLIVHDNGPPVGPPPPPPPPLSIGSELPPSSGNSTASANKSTDMRSALLESIRQGKNLKSVSAEPKSNEPSRNDMLKQIQGGVVLKPPSAVEPKSPTTSAPVDEVTDIAMALKKVLESRSIAIRSDDDTDTGTSSDDEWDA